MITQPDETKSNKEKKYREGIAADGQNVEVREIIW